MKERISSVTSGYDQGGYKHNRSAQTDFVLLRGFHSRGTADG